MTEITIKDFQSIEDVHFKIDGFTVIVGKNDIGKSAVIRSIDAALTNLAGKDFIRWGKKNTEVNIKRDGLDILWKKGDKTVYTVNNENFSALNRAIPEPLEKAGFSKMELGDKKISINLAPQFDPLFLVNQSGPVVTEVLTSLYDLDIYNTADELCQKELKGQKSLLKTRTADLQTLEGNLVKYEGFEDIKVKVESLVALEKECNVLKAEIAELLGYENEISTLAQSLNNLKKVHKIPVPDTKDTQNKITEYQWLIDNENLYTNLSTDVKKLEPVLSITIPDNTYTLGLSSELETIKGLEKDLLESAAKVKGLSVIQSVQLNLTATDDLELLVTAVGELKQWETERSKVSKTVQELSKVSSIKIGDVSTLHNQIEADLKDFQAIADLDKNFMSTAISAKALRDELKEVSTKHDAKVDEYNKFKSSLGVCPLCERAF
jgi:hypothetical protein